MGSSFSCRNEVMNGLSGSLPSLSGLLSCVMELSLLATAIFEGRAVHNPFDMGLMNEFGPVAMSFPAIYGLNILIS